MDRRRARGTSSLRKGGVALMIGGIGGAEIQDLRLRGGLDLAADRPKYSPNILLEGTARTFISDCLGNFLDRGVAKFRF